MTNKVQQHMVIFSVDISKRYVTIVFCSVRYESVPPTDLIIIHALNDNSVAKNVEQTRHVVRALLFG